MRKVGGTELVIIAADLNAHVGDRKDGFESVHGRHGYRKRNNARERIFEIAEAMEPVISTWYEKREEHLITYKSGPNRTQIDHMIMRKADMKVVTDCKSIPGEATITQHRILVKGLEIKRK
nr:uncharacterized protein LOC113808359 [Penaeus vannamei]